MVPFSLKCFTLNLLAPTPLHTVLLQIIPALFHRKIKYKLTMVLHKKCEGLSVQLNIRSSSLAETKVLKNALFTRRLLGQKMQDCYFSPSTVNIQQKYIFSIAIIKWVACYQVIFTTKWLLVVQKVFPSFCRNTTDSISYNFGERPCKKMLVLAVE